MSHISPLKRCLSLLLVWGMLCGLMVFPSAQAAGRPPKSGEWFYSQLSSPANQEAYDAIYNQVEKLAENSTDPSAVSFTPTQGSPDGTAIFAFFRDHPEYFWVDSSKLSWSVSTDGVWNLATVVTGESFFYEGFEVGSLSSVRNEFKQKVDDIIAEMPTDGDIVAQLRYLNNWIAQNNVYNPLGVGASNYSRCAASGILSDNREATGPVCYGYATAFKVLLDAADIPNAYIEGWAYNQNNWPYGEQHAWNYVQLDDGKWYAIDPTWDDPKLATAPARFHYFLVGSETVTETSSTMSTKGMFGQNHEVTKSPANSYSLTYPTLSATASDQVVTSGFELIQGGSSTKYDTLEAALQAAQSGGTVKLWEPVTITQTLTIPDGVTLDLNGQNSISSLSNIPVAISGSITGPLFTIDSGSEVSIVTSGNFTSLENKDLSTCIQNNGTLTLGNNLALTPGVVGNVISGNTPKLAPQSYQFTSSSSKVYNVYLVAQPESPQPGSYSAQSGDTVQNLIDRIALNGNGPSLSLRYYTSTGTTRPMAPSTISWTLSRSPNDGNHTDPDDPLENGDYTFIAQVYDYAVPYTVTVSGVPDAPKQYTVTVNGGDGATGEGDYTEGEEVTVTAGTKAGYTFQKWTASGVALSNPESSTVTFEMPDNDVTLTANFVQDSIPDPEPDQFTVTVNGGTGSTGAGQYKEGDEVTVTAGTREGYTFQKWTASGVVLSNPESSTVTFEMPANDVTLTADFVQDSIPDPEPGQFTVTVNAGTGATGAGQYKEGDKVTVTAGTKAGYTFTNWTTSGVSLSNPNSSTITFEMPGNDVTLTADFVQDSIPDPEPGQFTVTVNGGTGATGAGQYKEGDKVTVTAGTKAGYTFQKWTASGVALSNPNASTATFEMPGNDVTLTAYWTQSNPGGGSSASDDDDDDYTPPTSTEKHPDGSTTTTTTTGGTKTETTKYPDGSKEVVKTEKDGTVTTTVTDQDGNQTETIQKPNGSVQTTMTKTDGSSIATTITSGGRVESTVKLPAGVVGSTAGRPVALPIPEVPVTSERDHASTVTLTLPENTSAKVEIPVKQPTSGTVAVLVRADGTETIIKTSVTTDTGVTVTLQDGDTVKIVDNSKTYADVPSNYWGVRDIQFTASRELFAGTSATNFSPDIPMDRAMFWTVLARYDGVDTNSGPTWYQRGQVWAVNNGISDGALPNQPITREQLVTMLYRYAQSAGQDVSARGSLSRYQDQHQVSSFAEEAVSWATAEGILSGTSASTLSPGGLASRAEVAALLTRYCTWSA